MRIYSWNINGIRAAQKKGFLEWVAATDPDILCLQESKAHRDQVEPSLQCPEGYWSHWVSAQKRGYSGVVTYSKEQPLQTELLGEEDFDNEGRVQLLYYPRFVLVNAYFPNSQEQGKRLDYKLNFCDVLLARCQKIRKEGMPILLCGDYNIAHQAIDLARPKENEQSPGYFPEERSWMSHFLSEGFIDTFRHQTPDPHHYTWWSYRAKARERNVGWRIDYHCVSEELQSAVLSSTILPDVLGSDHCPVLVELSI